MAGTKLRLSQNQKLALTPAMRQSLAVLQMSAETLAETLQAEAAENPFIEVGRIVPSRHFAPDWLNDQPARPEGLHASLVRQISMQRLDPSIAAAARLLAGELREDGYLDTPLQELAREADLPLDVLDRGLAALQRCDPAGVGARTLAECLTLQLVDRGVTPALARACIDRIEDFAAARWPQLSRSLSISVEEVRLIAGLLPGLTSTPVAPDAPPLQTRIPDLIAEHGAEGHVSIGLNPDANPRVRVRPLDRHHLADPSLGHWADRAARLSDGIRARRETLLKVAALIASTQRDFFCGGQRSLAPMLQREAAGLLGLHPSTLSRALRDKSLVCDGRVFPLSLFFQNPIPGSDGALSAFDVQFRIRALISAEDPTCPLADDAITSHLRNEGVDIARRTVAKYRKWMRIPPSFARRHRRASKSPAPQ